MTEQGTDEWLAERAGRITASRFKDVIGVNKSGKFLKARDDYMMELAFERLSGSPKHSVSSQSMQWGTEAEPIAREAYELHTGLFVDETGLIIDPRYDFIGGSPDGIIDDDGIIEIKSPHDEKVHIRTWLEGMPDHHMPQVQGNMMVTGRHWCDFISFDPRQAKNYQLYVQRIDRDDEYINDLMNRLVNFEQELQFMIEKITSRAA
ncbi:YqaJ-like viral recombinase domain [Halomonadaceae bacterium LMG 33818]|uniref:lambda exonuclease family protein n=1 Tax=Cernens ardua TaxID=3402176 RepID=UPI003EDC455E